MEDFKNATKKCPACAKWSTWRGNASENCEHCNAILDPETRELELKEEYRKANPQPEGFRIEFIKIKNTDSIPLIMGKYLVLVGQVTFFVFVSIWLWIAAVIAG